MPLRTNTKSPGEFIRDHLVEAPGQRDFVGSMFRRYKNHLQGAGVVKLPCRQTFSTYIYLLKETGAVVFDGAEAVAFGGEEFQPEALPVDYVPACGMPAPRHYYRMTAFDHPAFLNPKGVWRQARGLPTAAPPQLRPLPAARLIAPVAEAAPPAEEAPTAARGRRRSQLQILLAEGKEFIPRLESLRTSTSPTPELDELEEELLDFFDRVVDTADRSRGTTRSRLSDLGGNLERASLGFEGARDALDSGDPEAFEAAIDLLLTCCVPPGS